MKEVSLSKELKDLRRLTKNLYRVQLKDGTTLPEVLTTRKLAREFKRHLKIVGYEGVKVIKYGKSGYVR